MSEAPLFRAREYLKGSLWFYPLAGAIGGPLLAVLTRQAARGRQYAQVARQAG